jgi:hypothetical protein
LPCGVAEMNDEEKDMAGGGGKTSARQPGPPAGTSSEPLANEKADLGNALRTVYQRTVEEDVPQEMLDLLRRLG